MENQTIESVILDIIDNRESETAEFKVNNCDPQRIGVLVSAVSNSAAIAGRACGYIVWGVADDTGEIVGTTFKPKEEKKGGQLLTVWLASCLQPSISFHFRSVTMSGRAVVVLEIPAAMDAPTKFNHIAYIRVGSGTPKLSDYPQREVELIRALKPFVWERAAADTNVGGGNVVKLLDCEAYFSLLQSSAPKNSDRVLEVLEADGLIDRTPGGMWNIRNIAAILLARHLSDFPSVKRKAIRVVQYAGRSRTEAIGEIEGARGYAVGFRGLVSHMESILPKTEEYSGAMREDKKSYPPIAIRELAANALIHQDFSIAGAGPTIEVFRDRIEFTNPGEPLIAVDRFIDMPPRSRNENVASLLRRMRICEERGSGVDKIVSAVEQFHLPAPSIRVDCGNTKVTLFSKKPFAKMDRDEKLRACYQHCVLRFVENSPMTNSTLRHRLGVLDRNSAAISRLINHATEARLIRQSESWNPRTGYYVPYWA